ncbi:Laminin G domain [Trinorchestia longiramus]|nr:Laminin G domain [Trinorchestia longiramus]
MDSGRGGAEIWTAGPIDRENHKTVTVQVLVTDAGGLSAVHPLVIYIDDTNDNPMLPATKTVHLWIPRGGNGEASLGRVYVDDPDDHDLQDKRFSWRGAPHPLFSLDSITGQLYSSAHVREGRYELQLSASDSLWQQKDVPANVTVLVRELDPAALSHAVQLTLYPVRAHQLTAHWTPSLGGGLLGALLDAVLLRLKEFIISVEVVSLADNISPPQPGDTSTPQQRPADPSHDLTSARSSGASGHVSYTKGYAEGSSSPHTNNNQDKLYSGSGGDRRQTNVAVRKDNDRILRSDDNPALIHSEEFPDVYDKQPSARLWLSGKIDQDTYIDSVKFQGLLGLHLDEIEDATNKNIFLEDEAQVLPSPFSFSSTPSFMDGRVMWPSSSATSLASTTVPLQVSASVVILSRSLQPQYNEVGAPPSNAAKAAVSTLGLPDAAEDVVDGNSSALVTPRLSRPVNCGLRSLSQSLPSSQGPFSLESCGPGTCLNGGRCGSFQRGQRCVCPGHTIGPYCKIAARSFSGSGWAWLPPLPPCKPSLISFSFLTTRDTAILLYSGSLSKRTWVPSKHSTVPSKRSLVYSEDTSISIGNITGSGERTEIPHKRSSFPRVNIIRNGTGHSAATATRRRRAALAVQLVDGRLQVILQAPTGKTLAAFVNSTNVLSNGKWHDVHIRLMDEGLSALVDRCAGGWMGPDTLEARHHCVSHAKWDPHDVAFWTHSGVLQLGGLAQASTHDAEPRSMTPSQPKIVTTSFKGCISHLRINEKLVDLGHVSHGWQTSSGCQMQNDACMDKGKDCGARGRCVGGLGDNASCSCAPGFEGPQCERLTRQATLLRSSYAKLAVSFTPDPLSTSLQLRLRTRRKSGLLLQLSAHHQTAAFLLKFQRGKLCAFIKGVAVYKVPASPKFSSSSSSSFVSPVSEACLPADVVSDGQWHTVTARRYGHELLLEVDDADDARHRNESLVMLDEAAKLMRAPHRLVVDKQDGICMGGLPYFAGINVLSVDKDFYDSCISDVRVDGHQLPLPPELNGTRWGQVTTWQNMTPSCVAAPSCSAAACGAPLLCIDTWRSYACSCPPGHQLGAGRCRPVDECATAPCLHGSTCVPVPLATPFLQVEDLHMFPTLKRTPRSEKNFGLDSWALPRLRRSTSRDDNDLKGSDVIFQSSDIQDVTNASLPLDLELPASWTETMDGEVGFRCVCGSWSSGRYCEWTAPRQKVGDHVNPLLVLGLLISLALFLSLVVVGLFLWVLKRRQKRKKVFEDIQLSKCSFHKEDFVDDSTLSPSELCISGPSPARQCLHLTATSGSSKLQSVKLDPGFSGAKIKQSCLLHQCEEGVEAAGIRSISQGVAADVDVVPERAVQVKHRTGTVQDLLRCPSACLSGAEEKRMDSDAVPDDLRAYAYEGEGSSGSSWTSTVSGFPSDGSNDDESCKNRLVPEFHQVMDLLKNLPDSITSKCEDGKQMRGSTIACDCNIIPKAHKQGCSQHLEDHQKGKTLPHNLGGAEKTATPDAEHSSLPRLNRHRATLR